MKADTVKCVWSTSILVLILALVSGAKATAPSPSHVQLDTLLEAIAQVESNGDPEAVGDGGRARGMYQIHRAYWQDGIRLLGADWSYEQARDPQKARAVVRAYLLHYGKGKSLIDMARIHNGGPRGYRKRATLKYARKVAEILDDASSSS